MIPSSACLPQADTHPALWDEPWSSKLHHVMGHDRDNRMSTLKNCLDAAANFLLSEVEAVSIIEDQIATIANEWDRVCEEARLTETDERLFAGRQFLNAYCVDGLGESRAAVAKAFGHARRQIANT